MSNKKEPTTTKPQATRSKAINKIGKPNISILAHYSPTDGANSHPDWVKKRFPSYIAPHAGHDDAGVREFSHDGHIVRITTTYRVEVDGHSIRAHLAVDENGQVYTHATPFVTYASAVDLVKAVINAYPDAFAHLGRHGNQVDHGHDHGGGHS